MDDSILTELPTEVQLLVLGLLDFEDLLRCSLVCRRVAELSNELIEKRGMFRIKHTFPDINMLSNLVRSYRCLYLKDEYFMFERQKMVNIINILIAKKMSLREVRLEVWEWEGTYDPEKIKEVFDLLVVNPNIQTVCFYHNPYCRLNKLFDKIKSVLPHANVDILESREEQTKDLHRSLHLINPEKLMSLDLYTEITDLQLLKILKTYPHLKTLQCSLKSFSNSQHVIQEVLKLNLLSCSIENLDLYIRNLDETTPILSIFKKLKSLDIAFNGDNTTADRINLIQILYSNNEKTLRSLKLRYSGTQPIFSMLPRKYINLILEELKFDKRTKTWKDKDLEFVKWFLNQQIRSLRRLCIKRLEIDDEVIALLSETKQLQRLCLKYCQIDYPMVTPSFPNLKELVLDGSDISYYSLHQILGSHHIQSTLESLSLINIHRKVYLGQNIARITQPQSYNFQNLLKLNLVFCEMKIGILSQICAPKLEHLHQSEEPLSCVLKYPRLKVVSLKEHNDLAGISNILTLLDNLEFFAVTISSSLLAKVVELLLITSKNIKLADITCTDLDDVLRSFQLSFNESAQKCYSDFKLEFIEKSIRFSNISRTIFIHNTQTDVENHGSYYEDVFLAL